MNTNRKDHSNIGRPGAPGGAGHGGCGPGPGAISIAGGMGYDDEFGQCRQCGYDLLGLPDVGRCPECGRRYDRHSGKGLRLKRRSAEDVDQLLGRVRTISLAVAAVLILVCSGVLANAKGKSRILWVGAFVTLVTALAAWTSHLYERDDEDED